MKSLLEKISKTPTGERLVQAGREHWAQITRHQSIIIAVVLSLILLGVVLLPTVKTVRTVEVHPAKTPVTLSSEQPLTSTVLVPAGEMHHFFVWVKDRADGKRFPTSAHRTVETTIQSFDGEVIATAKDPSLVKRADKLALQFNFEGLVTAEDAQYLFTLRQVGEEPISFIAPLTDHFEPGEVSPVAFQLGVARNWLTLLKDFVQEESLIGKDISFYHHRGEQIIEGTNPYSCILDEGETCVGYPAHFPGMYLFAAGAISIGVDGLEEWGMFWRPIMFASWLAVGIVLLVQIYRWGQPALAIAALGFWLFNRWSLNVLRVSHTDFLGVLLVLSATLLIGRAPLIAALLFGASLAVKQVAIVLVPLFLIVLWRSGALGYRKFALATFLLLLIPVATALPFLIDDPQATLHGWFTAATRPAQTLYAGVPSFDHWLDVTHAGKSLPLIVLLGMVYVAAWRRKVDMIGGALMIMAVVVGFTHVLFHQYFVWFLAFIPLAVAAARRKLISD